MNKYLLISYQLSYPTEDVLSSLELNSSLAFWMKENNLYALQEHYVQVFDQCASCSLYLFEHVHGDSKERGGALVSLKKTYEKEGCLLDSSELPDYLPVFFEFLSLLDEEKAQELLANVSHILSRVVESLQSMNSPYHELLAPFVVRKEAFSPF